jgi:hypothetical protein
MADLAHSFDVRIPEESRIVAICVDRYEEAVAGGEFPDIRQMVESIPTEHQAAALLEVALVDMEYRWKRQRGKTTEEYLAAYSELHVLDRAERELLCAEAAIRQSCDEKFDVEKFAAEHPHKVTRTTRASSLLIRSG